MNTPYFFNPSIALSKYISKYWYCKNIQFLPILPPGSGCELFIFNQKIMVVDSEAPHQSHYVDSVLVRPRHAPVHFMCDGPVSFISIRFRLGSINYFTRDLESDYQALMSPYDVWGQNFYSMRENVLNTNKMPEKINLIEHFLQQVIQVQHAPKIDLAKFFLDEMYYNPSQRSLSDIVKNIGYSERHLQKTVKLVTGLTLIQAKKLIRFEHTVKKILFQDSPHLSKRYLDEYYDQSHFIKDFSGFTGMSPTCFVTEHQESAMFYKKMALSHEP
ncbi:helix-turn-helix domain-containing protein [Acinetobacter rathckeae]|uniref:helix-turn-helix domain-containing protein n=1 Tax=Acinetobacter rathckeae TaxID=2605272 RepID=UPI0018A28195|nr:helix-turn-helix domain-containing protein [Acinetobacter rathckeae]MBF7695403.1 AraC family transcriptional regulator [Acinetobacter rathckeae]